MSQEALNPRQFFHGSTHVFEEGQILDPQGRRDPHVYFAGNKTEPTSGNYGSHLYEVQPLGEYEPDPALAHIPELESLRTKHPVRVVKRHTR
jgi:hypothetical protein